MKFIFLLLKPQLFQIYCNNILYCMVNVMWLNNIITATADLTTLAVCGIIISPQSPVDPIGVYHIVNDACSVMPDLRLPSHLHCFLASTYFYTAGGRRLS